MLIGHGGMMLDEKPQLLRLSCLSGSLGKGNPTTPERGLVAYAMTFDRFELLLNPQYHAEP